MNRISKSFAVFFILIIAISSLSLLMVKPANAQSNPTPSVPEFTLSSTDYSYDVLPTTTTAPYTEQIIHEAGYHVENGTVTLTIKNQPFTSYYNANGFPIKLYYNIRLKNHNDNNWYYYPDNDVGANGYFPADNASFTVRQFNYLNNGFAYNWETYFTPTNGKIDFQVVAFIGYFNVTNINPSDIVTRPDDLITTWVGQTSGWSNTQTITIPASSISTNSTISPTATPTSTPTVPEFPLLAVLSLFLSTLSIAGILKLRKQRMPKNML